MEPVIPVAPLLAVAGALLLPVVISSAVRFFKALAA